MTVNNNDIYSRLKEFIEFTGLSMNMFGKAIDEPGGQISQMVTYKKKFGIDKLLKIVNTYPELNPNWLLKGEGTMLIKDLNNQHPVFVTVDEAGSDNIVLIDVKASAGYPSRYLEPSFLKELPAFKLPGSNYRNGTFRAFEVEGDSMSDTIKPGSWAISRRLDCLDDISDGYVHVIITNTELSIKRVVRNPEEGTLELHSDNNAYPLRHVPYGEIREVWRCVAQLTNDFLKKETGSPLAFVHEFSDLKERVMKIEKLLKTKR